MAIRDAGPDGAPVFCDPEAPFLQLLYVDLALSDHHRIERVGICQNDDEFGLVLRSGSERDSAAVSHEGSFRHRHLSELPVGEISGVQVTLSNRNDLAEVPLVVDGHELMLMAGEVYETTSGSLKICRLDESVLVFTDPRTVESITWMPARP
jgi:hypothetical protein